ncbi:hypothetical protein [Spirochaeta cellobiosiphila]|uniref:hypothetical protein n=1 Tax=Spirochaeta cellobiosiphila TaxID=504483 RepID=UPI000408EFF8|nr:hypothetical protein [Spirochaeta cellobiosiphila]
MVFRNVLQNHSYYIPEQDKDDPVGFGIDITNLDKKGICVFHNEKEDTILIPSFTELLRLFVEDKYKLDIIESIFILILGIY